MNITNMHVYLVEPVRQQNVNSGLQWAVGVITLDWHNTVPCIPCQ